MDMQNCTLCPRLCHVDRTKNYGVCHASDKVEIALVSLHQWEEPCLSGTNGAGTVFFSHCNMRCIFCQNHEISTEGKGFPVTVGVSAELICIPYLTLTSGTTDIPGTILYFEISSSKTILTGTL